MLSYFGCDQSQVQRYLTAKSVDEARQSLLMSAFVKIPLQSLVLLIGVLMFVVLRVHAAAAAVQRRARGAGPGERPRRRVRGAGAAVRRRGRPAARPRTPLAPRGAGAPRPLARRRAAFAQGDAAVTPRPCGGDGIVRDVTGDRAYSDVNYVVPDLRHDAHADRPGRPDHRGDLRRLDVGQSPAS